MHFLIPHALWWLFLSLCFTTVSSSIIVSAAAVCIPTFLAITSTYCTFPTCSASSLCLVAVWPCVIFFPLSPSLPFLPIIFVSVLLLPLSSASLFNSHTFLYLLFISLSFQFMATCFLLTLSPSLALFSSFPSFAPSLRLSVWHRVSQSPWWCAPCTLLPHTVLPPSCVNMPVIWAAPPCAESWVGGWKETEPSWACTGLDLLVHTHTQTQAHIHTVMHACTHKHTTPYTWMRDRFNPVSRTEANSEAHFMPEINKGIISQQTRGEK